MLAISFYHSTEARGQRKGAIFALLDSMDYQLWNWLLLFKINMTVFTFFSYFKIIIPDAIIVNLTLLERRVPMDMIFIVPYKPNYRITE